MTAEPTDWGAVTSRRIGRQIKALRGKRSAQQIADRTKELGYPIGRATLSQLENGTRKAPTVPEVIVIAAALDTSPAALVFGEGLPDEEADVEMLPGRIEPAMNAFFWFVGADSEPTDGILRKCYMGEFADPRALGEAIAESLLNKGFELEPRMENDGDD